MARLSLVSWSGSSDKSTSRRSRAAFRPSPVTLSMLSTLGSIRSFLQSLSALDKRLDIALERVTGRGCFDDRSAGLELGPRQLEHIPGLNVRDSAEHGAQFGHIDEQGETRVHSIA